MMKAKELAEIVRTAHRRIVAKRINEFLTPNPYERIRRQYWAYLIAEGGI